MVKADDIRLVIMTVRRSPEYIHKTLASLMLSDPLVHQLKGIHVVVGGADIEYLNQYQHHKIIQIHPMPWEDVEKSRDWIVHRKLCLNYHRCLTVLVQDYHGLCICEDDIAFQDGFIEKMLSAVNELEDERNQHHFLLNLYLSNHITPDPYFQPGKTVIKYLSQTYYGTQCIYYSKSMVSEIARMIYEQGVAEHRSAVDLLIGKYLNVSNNLYGPGHSLVQHIGFHSTGVAGMFHRSYTFNTTLQPVHGKEEYEVVYFDLWESIGGIVKKLSFEAQSKGVELIVNISVDVPKNVAGKLSLLYPLLHKLVTYAIEHTEQGEVIVLVQVESVVADDLCLHFTISDTGTGRQKSVFESMVNERPINEEDKGLAKILSHCSGLATILNGELWIEVDEKDVQSESDGCTLHFTVHFQKSQQTYPQSGSRVLEAVRELPVLVVDDNVSNRNLLVNMLAGWGIQAHSAADGVSALELLHKRRLSGNQFWMVLLDASMPGMDGFTVAKQIVEHSGLAKFVLMMTSYDIEGDRASMCRDAGVHDQLHKPILPSELLEAFRYFIEVS